MAFVCQKCDKKYKLERSLTKHLSVCHFFDVADVSPPNSLKSRGYNYDSPEKLINNKEDEELMIPEFETQTVFKGTPWTTKDVRQRVVAWLYGVSLSPKFRADPITTFCMAVELFDKVMLSFETLDVNHVQLVGVVCLWVAGKFNLDHFEIYTDAADIADYTAGGYTKKDVLRAEKKLLERVQYCVSSRYTVPWFVDYLNGFDTTPQKKRLLYDKLADCHQSGRYRLKDPHTLAVELLVGL